MNEKTEIDVSDLKEFVQLTYGGINSFKDSLAYWKHHLEYIDDSDSVHNKEEVVTRIKEIEFSIEKAENLIKKYS